MFDFLSAEKRNVITEHSELGKPFFAGQIDKKVFIENLRAFARDLCNKELDSKIRFRPRELVMVIRQLERYPSQKWIGDIMALEDHLKANPHILGLGIESGYIGSKRFTVSYNGVNFAGLLEITESTDPESSKLAEMTIELHSNETVVAKFRSIFRYDDASTFEHGISSDRKTHKYWISQHREIDKRYRGIGLGELLMRLWEQIADQIAVTNPKLKPEWLQVNTSLGSVAKLIIDQEWLRQHNLERYGSPKRNLGYMPFRDDEQKVPILLESAIEDIEDPRYYTSVNVRFFKRK